MSTIEILEGKIDKILETVLPLGPMVKEHHITLYGNGQPGLKEDVALMSQKQDDCPARKSALDENKRDSKKVTISTIALILSAITTICCIVTMIVKLG